MRGRGWTGHRGRPIIRGPLFRPFWGGLGTPLGWLGFFLRFILGLILLGIFLVVIL